MTQLITDRKEIDFIRKESGYNAGSDGKNHLL